MPTGKSLLIAAILLSSPVWAATYYVDFDKGDDAQPGTTQATAWKHAPGDRNAAGKPRSATLAPGDAVLFKGGVTYRGSIVVNSSGAEGSPITLDGNSGRFGQGRAVIDGSEVVSGWQPCRSAEEAGGDPNWKNIYWAWLSAPVAPFSSNMYQGEKMCWLAQDPKPQDPFYQDRPEGHRRIVQATADTITDPQVFTQPEADAWDGAWLIVYADPQLRLFRPGDRLRPRRSPGDTLREPDEADELRRVERPPVPEHRRGIRPPR